MIGIVSHEGDLHARTVRQQLDEWGAAAVVIDTATLPASLALTSTQNGTAWAADWGGVDADDLSVMWWRRPQPFTLHEDVRNAQDRHFAVGECAAAVSGLWSCLNATWVNAPDLDEAASRKMWQLKVAAQLGFRVPRTCMTNDPERARAFIASEPSTVIFKPFSGTPQTWRETRPIRPSDVELLDHVRFAPVIFQEAIPGGCDLRVTIVGDEIFAAEILAADSAYEFDFRVDSANAPTRPVELPVAVQRRLRALMRWFGLFYGAVDLRRAPNGDYVFLEINPAGQWLFVEYATGQRISTALAALLVRLDREAAEQAA